MKDSIDIRMFSQNLLKYVNNTGRP